MKLAAVSIDLDSLSPLARRRGLPAPDPDVVYRQALPRFRALLDQAGVRATFFALGADARRPIPRGALATLVDEGHEVANHSHDHPDDFAGLHPEALHQQVARAEDAIASATGVAPVGFRAPAWAVSGPLLELLERRGYRYDSSVLPSPLTGALALLYRVREGGQGPRPFGDPRLGRAPTAPYHPHLDEPWRSGSARLLELPVAAGLGRLPAWFTPALALGPGAVPVLHRILAASPAPQWLLHGADLLDVQEAPVVATRPGMQRSLETRQDMVRDLLRRLADGFRVLPLRDLAAAWSERADG